MADTDQDLDELGRSAREAARALEQITGLNKTVTKSSEDLSESSLKHKQATDSVNKAMQVLEKTIGRNIKTAYNGEKAGKQFAIAIEQAADVLTAVVALAGPFGKLGRIIGVVGIQLAKLFGKESVEQAQKLYDTYQQIGSVGGVAGTSLEGLAETAMTAGFGIEQLDKFAAVVKSNSSALAMFGGSVSDGTQAFTNIVNPLIYGKVGERLQNMGLGFDEIRETTARYMKLQARMGFSERTNLATLQKGTAAYIEELNLLTRLTGATAEEQQVTQDRLMSQQRFRAAFEEAKMSGDQRRLAEMQKAMTMFTYYTSIGATDLAQGVADASTGFIGTSKEAGKIFLAVPNIVGILKDANLDAYESIRLVSKSASEQAKSFTGIAKMTDAYGQSFLDYSQAMDAGKFSKEMGDEQLAKLLKEMTPDAGSSISKFTQATIGLQLNARDALQELIRNGVKPATDAMAAYSLYVTGLITGTNEKKSLAGNMWETIKDPESYKSPSDLDTRNNQKKLQLRGDTDPLNFMIGLAGGGLARAGRPYVVGENGPEVFVPNQNGEVISNQQSSAQIMRVNNQQIADMMSTIPKDIAEVIRSKVSSNKPTDALEQALEAELLKANTTPALETPAPKMSNEEKELIQQQNAKLDQMIAILTQNHSTSRKILSSSYS